MIKTMTKNNNKTLLSILKDPTRNVALVIQGGGMRGVYSAGILGCFLENGLGDSFKDVVANSAGALNAGYFLSAQAGAMNVYIDLLSNKKFINLKRQAKKIDIDYMVDVALHNYYPIDLEALNNAKSKFHVIVTDAQSGKRVIISDHKKFKEIYEEFRATSALPVFYDKAVKINKHYFIDGGVSDLIPVLVAASYKPTDIVVIMTRPLGDYKRRMALTTATRGLIKQVARNQSLPVQNQLPTNQVRLKHNIEALQSGQVGDAKIHLLCPTSKLEVGATTINREKLERVAELGWADAETFLAQKVMD